VKNTLIFFRLLYIKLCSDQNIYHILNDLFNALPEDSSVNTSSLLGNRAVNIPTQNTAEEVFSTLSLRIVYMRKACSRSEETEERLDHSGD
jgi:hypothetical protein